jgi:acyl-CoA thioesterase-2
LSDPDEDAAAAVRRLSDLLDLDQLDVDLFEAPRPEPLDENPPPGVRLFGGQVAGQAMRAASLTVDEARPVHSMHCYFLRPGQVDQRIFFRVDRSREGSSFTTRHVSVRQNGQTIFELIASFQRPEDGHDYALPISDVPSPDDVDERESVFSFDGPAPSDPFELAPLRSGDDDEPGLDRTTLRFWLRTRARLPDDGGLHASVLAYMSDMRSGSAAMAVVGVQGWPTESFQIASLDHAMWFHRPIRADDWLLLDVRPISVSNSRGLVIGTIHDRSGRHGVSFTQELLIRDRR